MNNHQRIFVDMPWFLWWKIKEEEKVLQYMKRKEKEREKGIFNLFFSPLSLFQFKGLSILFYFFFFIRGAKWSMSHESREPQLIRDLVSLQQVFKLLAACFFYIDNIYSIENQYKIVLKQLLIFLSLSSL